MKCEGVCILAQYLMEYRMDMAGKYLDICGNLM